MTSVEITWSSGNRVTLPNIHSLWYCVMLCHSRFIEFFPFFNLLKAFYFCFNWICFRKMQKMGFLPFPSFCRSSQTFLCEIVNSRLELLSSHINTLQIVTSREKEWICFIDKAILVNRFNHTHGPCMSPYEIWIEAKENKMNKTQFEHELTLNGNLSN